VPASEIAQRHLGRPLPNAALLGGFAAISGLITLEAVAHAIRDKFAGRVAEGNVAAAAEAFEFVRREMEELSHAQAD
jgi:pyruvate ferredoxin oxidoreductase gamma subunit